MKVTGKNISMTRGDSETITVSCNGLDFTDGDVVEMTIRKTATSPVVFHKAVTEFDNGNAIIVFDPADTADIEFGKYQYDIQVTLADGTVATIVKPSNFTFEKEITYG